MIYEFVCGGIAALVVFSFGIFVGWGMRDMRVEK
jgi:hypothetical protein